MNDQNNENTVIYFTIYDRGKSKIMINQYNNELLEKIEK